MSEERSFRQIAIDHHVLVMQNVMKSINKTLGFMSEENKIKLAKRLINRAVNFLENKEKKRRLRETNNYNSRKGYFKKRHE